MTDDDDIQEYSRPCPNCEYHRKRAQLWRDEAYKQAGHPLPEREWVGLDPVDWNDFNAVKRDDPHYVAAWAETKLKEKNT